MGMTVAVRSQALSAEHVQKLSAVASISCYKRVLDSGMIPTSSR
jgi:hypothetical protein